MAWASNDNGRVRYAVTLFGRRVTPWRASRDDAVDDAIRDGHASRDHEDADLYWWAGTDLVERQII